MSSKRITSGIVSIDFEEETGKPLSVVIQLNDSVLLTPNVLSAQMLILTLKWHLEGLHDVRDKLYKLRLKAEQQPEYEWCSLDFIPIGEEKKFWLRCRAISVYLNIQEAEQIVKDFEGCIGEVAQRDFWISSFA